MRRTILASALLLAATIACGAAAAQRGSGTIAGHVVGPDGRAVVGAQVILQTSDGRAPRADQTDRGGRFVFPFLQPGLYHLRAQAGPLRSEWKRFVEVRRGRQTEITLRLSREKAQEKHSYPLNLAGRVREWSVPVENSLPHDPAVDPDGNVWLTLQRANQLARLDPDTGQWKLFTAPTAGSGPHGLVSDDHGNIWFTENSAGKIGRVDGRTGRITEYAAPTAKDPHTPIFGPDGALWFTAQSANLLVRLDVRNGEMREFRVPTPNARPYGIVLGPGGKLWFCEFGTNKLGRMDPASGKITEYAIPRAGARPRRLTATSDAIYFTDFAEGRLGRLDLGTLRFEDWPSPSGAESKPYGIVADEDGEVWYCEYATNRLVRFSPETRTFQTFDLTSPRAEVRQMVRDSHGRIWLALSGANKVAVIE